MDVDAGHRLDSADTPANPTSAPVRPCPPKKITMLIRSASLLSLSVLLATPSALTAQLDDCGGKGRAVLTVTSAGNAGMQQNVDITMNVVAPAGASFCLGLDRDPGPTTIPGLGTICLGFSDRFMALCGVIPPSGLLQSSCSVPPTLCNEIYLQAVVLDPGQPTGDFGISSIVSPNICMRCRNLYEIGMVTTTDEPAAFPTRIEVKVTNDRDPNVTYGRTQFSFDPGNPPTFPVTDGTGVIIQNVVVLGGKLYIAWRANATLMTDDRGRPMTKFKANTGFETSVGDAEYDQVNYLLAGEWRDL
jgi:hypothetical protein